MALTNRRSSSRGADTGLKGFLTAVPEEKTGRDSTTTVVKKALAATANIHRLMGKADGQQVRQGSDELSQARGQTRFTQKDSLKRPAWGSRLTPGKPQQQRTPARHSKTSLASHPHRTQAAETPGAAALPTQRTLAFAHAAALAQERRLEGASADQGPTHNGSERAARGEARAAQGEEAGSPPHQSGQGPAAAKHTKKKTGDIPAAGNLQMAQVDSGQAFAAALAPSSPRSSLDFSEPQTTLSTAIGVAPKVSAIAQRTEPEPEADDKYRAPLEAGLAQSRVERFALQTALEKAERALDKERRAGVAQEEGFLRALQGSVKTAEAAEAEVQEARRSLAAQTALLKAAQAAAVDESNRRVDAENRTAHEAAQRVQAEARVRAAREALESARGEMSIVAAKKQEAETLAQTEALKRQQVEAQLEFKARECAALSASLTEERAARSATEDAERERSREDADAALRAAAETVARLEEELARAQSGAAAAARELGEVTAKLDAEKAKSEGRCLEASELAEKEAARRAQAEASWSQSQTLLARAEEAAGRAQERVTELEEQIAKMRAAEVKRADSEEWLRAEAGRRIEADAKAVHEEVRRREVEQRLAVERKARAQLEEKLRSAEGLKGAFEVALVESEAKLQALAEDRAQRKAAASTAESDLRAANARAEEAELKLEEARKQLSHQVTMANQSVAASTARVTQLEAELRQAQAAHAALQTEKETAAARVADLREVNAELEAEVSLKSAEVQGLVAEASKLTDDCLAEERRLKGEVASARAEVAVLKRELASARAALKKLSTPHAKSIKELEHEILMLKQMVATLQAAADSAAIAEAAERHARQAELKNAHDHVETLLEQLRIKNEEVDVLEQEADLMAKQRDDDATDRERLAYARLHAIGGKLNEITHKVTQLLAVLKEPGPSTAVPLDYVQTELERVRLFLEAEPCVDMADPSASSPSDSGDDSSRDVWMEPLIATGWVN